MWPFESEKTNEIVDVDKNPGKLVCVDCGITPTILYEVDDLYMCEECSEAHQRRERFKNEEEEWNLKTDTLTDTEEK